MIKYSQNIEIREKLRETNKYKEDTAKADAVMSRITDDMRAWAVKLSSEGGETDRLTNLAAAEKRGKERGLHAAKLEDARNGLNLSLSIEQIQILTGLSVSEIENL